VARILDRLGVAHDTYDAITSSGDVTRGIVESRLGQSVFHLGPERDHSIFTGLDVKFAPLESADYVICSGLFDDTVETPETYRDMLAAMRARSLFMVCANPDIVVERGDSLVYCAGALADAYAALGGEVLYCGKPHAPIYQAAVIAAQAARGGRAVPLSRVLAIGDSVRTDLTGAAAFGIDSLFVTSGIHAEEYGGRDTPDLDALKSIFAAAGVTPKAVMRGLDW
jgi:HAD superfamily hydrolase (TIGR01459 family)